jgi:hypothetical protein
MGAVSVFATAARLGLVSVVVHGFESYVTHDQIPTISDSKFPPHPVFISPRYQIPCPSPPTIEIH